MDQREKAKAGFRRMILWIIVAALVLVAGTIWYLTLGDEPASPHMIIAAILGVFLSVLIGGGLMATIFFSSKSGHDEEVSGEERRRPPPRDRH